MKKIIRLTEEEIAQALEYWLEIRGLKVVTEKFAGISSSERRCIKIMKTGSEAIADCEVESIG